MQAGIRNIMDNFQDTEQTQAVNTKLFMHSIRIQQVISPPMSMNCCKDGNSPILFQKL